LVQARRLRRINPNLRVDAIIDAVENVPLGKLKADVMLAGLDSRLARQVAGDRAWQLGTTLIDAGVHGPGLLARVSVFYPGPDNACPLCPWETADFEAIEQTYPCTVKADGSFDIEAPATNAPSGLGGVAASLVALECQRVLAGRLDTGRWGRELVLEADHGNLYVTRLEANRECPFHGHRGGPLVVGDTCPGTTTLGGAIDSAAAAQYSRLRVIGQSFVTRLTCPGCGDQRELLRLKVSLRRAGQTACRKCGVDMIPTGYGTRDELEIGSLPPRILRRSLNSVGLRDGDLLEIGGNGHAGEAHVIEVKNGRRQAANPRRQQ
jgi:molybdopterin/thiamine biosynthesis adenylyltransferase